jgi:hypothetical protein
VDNLNNCPNCGQPIQSGDKYCPNCGRPFEERPIEAPPPPPKPPIPPSPIEGTVPPPPPPQEEVKFVAWEERDKIGFFKALWDTLKESVTNPDKFFSHLPFSGGMGSPLLYAIIIMWIGYFFSRIYGLIFSSYWLNMFDRYFSNSDKLMIWSVGWVGFVLSLFAALIFIIVSIFIASGVFHLIGMVFGWTKRDFEATLRAVSYASGPAIFAIIPVCGSPIGTVWTIVLMVIGYKHMQQTSGGKATLVILLPFIFCCCIIVILALIFGAAIFAFVTKAMHSGGGYNFN